MDRGAARSRKRAGQVANVSGYQDRIKPDRPASAPSNSTGAGPSRPRPTDSATPRSQHSDRNNSKRPHPDKVPKAARARGPPVPQSRDPELYKPKAIRSSTALIWSEALFQLPPPTESLKSTTRIDLSGSDITDISWLSDAPAVRWLSLNGCQVTDWKPISGLTELTVLNVNGCGLTRLPYALKTLVKLKALVAMNNPWIKLEDEVIRQWKELNSLIISHSPNLVSLPASLTTLQNLSKLTYSHCPKLTATGLLNLSPLPYLRDVKMNNLPLLTSLPGHITSWGTGPLPEANGIKRHGEGLEVLDLGNCSLPESTLNIFTKNTWTNLRSLTLISNPLCIAAPTYATILQESNKLAKLQIIDSKRVVERKRKGEISERKTKDRGKSKKLTGTNVIGGKGKMRDWGEKMEDAAAEGGEDEEGKRDVKEKKKRKRDDETEGTAVAPKKSKGDRKTKTADHTSNGTKSESRGKRGDTDDTERSGRTRDRSTKEAVQPTRTEAQSRKPKTTIPTPQQSQISAQPPRIADPSAQQPPPRPKKPSRNETSVVGVIDVVSSSKNPKGKQENGKTKAKVSAAEVTKSHGGIDLKAMFNKPTATEDGGTDGSGLGVGGW